MEFFHGVAVTAGDCILRLAEDFADFDKGEFFPVFQDYDFVLWFGKSSEHSLDAICCFFPLNQEFGGIVSALGVDFAQTFGAAFLDDSESFVSDGSDKIGPRRIGLLQQLGFGRNSGKRPLNRVFRIGLIASDTGGQPHQSHGGQIEEFAERTLGVLRQATDTVAKISMEFCCG